MVDLEKSEDENECTCALEYTEHEVREVRESGITIGMSVATFLIAMVTILAGHLLFGFIVGFVSVLTFKDAVAKIGQILG